MPTQTIYGEQYNTIIVGGTLELMAENLAWDGAGSWWNDGAEDDGDGRYYDVPETAEIDSSISGGWRVPTHFDWIYIAETLSDSESFYCFSSCLPSRWQHPEICTNANGFSALPTSNYNGNTESWQPGYKNSYAWWWKHISTDLGSGTGYKNVTISEYNNVVRFDPSELFSPYPNVVFQNTRHTLRLVRDYSPPSGFSGVRPAQSGVWRNASEVHVAKDGVWRKANRIFVPVSGAWREVS